MHCGNLTAISDLGYHNTCRYCARGTFDVHSHASSSCISASNVTTIIKLPHLSAKLVRRIIIRTTIDIVKALHLLLVNNFSILRARSKR